MAAHRDARATSEKSAPVAYSLRASRKAAAERSLPGGGRWRACKIAWRFLVTSKCGSETQIL